MKYLLILMMAFSVTTMSCSEEAMEGQSYEDPAANDTLDNDTTDLEVLIPVGGAVERSTGGMR